MPARVGSPGTAEPPDRYRPAASIARAINTSWARTSKWTVCMPGAIGTPGFSFAHTRVAASCTRLLSYLGLG